MTTRASALLCVIVVLVAVLSTPAVGGAWGTGVDPTIDRPAVSVPPANGAGSVPWNTSTDGWVASSPAVANGVVYVGTWNGSVYALDGATGAVEWRYRTGDAVESDPVVVDGTVYVGSNDDTLHALDAATGAEQWTFSASDDIEAGATVRDGTVYVGSLDGNVYALDASTGAEQWGFETGGEVRSRPAVADGSVYVGSSDGAVYALDVSTGDERWNVSTHGWVTASPAVVEQTVYVGGTDGYVYALDVDTGAERWNATLGGPVESSPAVSNGTVFVGSYDRSLHALDTVDGTERWNFSTGGVVISAPAVADGTVVFGSQDENVYAVEADSGSELWSFSTNGWVLSSPTVANGTVFVGSFDTGVYAHPLNSDSSATTEHEIRIKGNGTSTPYEFSVTSEITGADQLQSNDAFNETTASGTVVGWSDIYTFTGDLSTLVLQGNATVYLDGERIDPTDYDGSYLLIEGNGTSTPYEFSVDDEITGVDQLQSNDEFGETTASGTVSSGSDEYTFTGNLSNLIVDGDAKVYIDGREVDSDDYDGNVIRIEGSGTSAGYNFSVSGNVTDGDHLQSNDGFDGTNASGTVVGGTDEYTFTGALLTLTIDGDATVYLNGKVVDPTEYGQQVIRIEGTGAGSQYQFGIDGEITDGRHLQSNDRFTETTASGTVSSGSDEYSFIGSLSMLIVDGEARVYLDGEEVIPADYDGHTLRIEGDGTTTQYDFGVSGEITDTKYLQSNDEFDEVTASGTVSSGADEYWFTGDLSKLNLEGNATVYIDGTKIDPADY